MWRHNLFSNFFPFLTSAAAGDPAAKKHNDAGDVISVIENYRNRNIGMAVMTIIKMCQQMAKNDHKCWLKERRPVIH